MKENELTTVNNFACVRALDENGNSIKIMKSDLFKVISDGVLKQSDVNKSIYSVEKIDLDDIKTLCISMVGPSAINNPTSDYGIFICLESRYTKNVFCVQFMIPSPISGSYGSLFFRECWDGWGKWIRLNGSVV